MQNDLFVRDQAYDFESGDLSASFVRYASKKKLVSCDLETSGLDWKSERIGLVQIYSPGGEVVVFKPIHGAKPPKRLVGLIEDPDVCKIFHHAMFDLRFIAHHWSAAPSNIMCTKIASKILEPDRKSHSLSVLLKEHMGITVDKSPQKSDWLSWDLSELQLAYARADVTHLPELLETLRTKLKAMGREPLADRCFQHIPTRVDLEIGGYGDVFQY